MFGCLRRLGCLVLLIVGAAAGYYWYIHRTPPAATAAAEWRVVSPDDVTRGARVISTLKSSSGKVFVNLTPTEAVGYLLRGISQQLPVSSHQVWAMIAGDTLNVRAVVPLRQLGADKILGPLGALLSERDTIQLGGTADVIRPGLAQFRVTRVMIHGLTLPSPVIPKLLAQLRKQSPSNTVPAGVAPDALAVPLPSYISDIRIANGKVTLYKNV